MQLTTLLNDDRGVSPVIGVILMVAITVILAAVIGTFVLGLGSSVGNNAPSATFNYDYSAASTFDDTGSDDAWVNVTHQGGDALDASTLSVTVGEVTLTDTTDPDANDDFTDTGSEGWSETVTAGDTLRLQESGGAFDPGVDVRVIWQSGSGSSSIIGSSTTPS